MIPEMEDIPRLKDGTSQERQTIADEIKKIISEDWAKYKRRQTLLSNKAYNLSRNVTSSKKRFAKKQMKSIREQLYAGAESGLKIMNAMNTNLDFYTSDLYDNGKLGMFQFNLDEAMAVYKEKYAFMELANCMLLNARKLICET